MIQVLIGNLGGLWIAFIGWFLNHAAAVSYRQVALSDDLKGFTAGQIMETDCPPAPEDATIEAFIHDYLLHSGRRCFPVLRGGKLLGVVTIHGLKKVPRAEWTRTPIRDVMIPFAGLVRTGRDETLDVVLKRLSEEGINQLAVTEGDRFLGMVSREHLIDFIRTRSELGMSGPG